MPALRFFILGLALIALAMPIAASAQSIGDGVSRNGGNFRDGGGNYRGGYRGGNYRGGLGLPGMLLPAIIAGSRAAAQARDQAQDDEPPRYRRPRPHPPTVIRPRPPGAPTVTNIRPHPQRLGGSAHPPRQSVAAARAAPLARKVGPGHAADLNLPPPGEERFLPDEVLAVLRAGATKQQIDALGRRQRLELVQTRDLTLIGLKVSRFRIADHRPVRRVLRALAPEALVVAAQPNYLFTLQQDAPKPGPESAKAEPEAAAAARVAAAKVEAPLPSYASASLHLSEAHQIATGRGVRVAVIDSLIDAGHPEIAGAVAASFDPLEDAKAQPQIHGTGMASAIVGHRQIDGVAPGAQILAVRAFGETDGGVRAAGLDILAGIDWAAAQGAQVINMSFAGPLDPLLGRMLAAAAERRIALIAAAGNEGPQAPPLYPAADSHVIAVSAIDAQAQVYVKANRGAYVALAAPGVDVLVAAPRAAYDLSTGTSVACAEVSGIAALLLERQPGLDGPALRRLLQGSAHALDGVAEAGAGAANAQAAIERLR